MKTIILSTSFFLTAIISSQAVAQEVVSTVINPSGQTIVCIASESEGTGIASESEGTGSPSTASESEGTGSPSTASESEGTGSPSIASESEGTGIVCYEV